MIIAFIFLKTTPFVWNFYNNTTIHPSQAITALSKPLNCCRAITGIPACMLTSSPTQPPANYALGASRRVTSNMASSRRSLFPPVPGNQSPVTSSSIFRCQMVSTQSSSSSTDSRRCLTSSPASNPPMHQALLECISTMLFACTVSLNPLSLIVDRSSRLTSGRRCQT